MKKIKINIYNFEYKLSEVDSRLLFIDCEDVNCPLDAECEKCIFNKNSIILSIFMQIFYKSSRI